MRCWRSSRLVLILRLDKMQAALPVAGPIGRVEWLGSCADGWRPNPELLVVSEERAPLACRV
jgi:hypothetical protein